MELSTRKPLYELPPYSLTGDILSFQTCPLQYRYHNLGGLPPSRPVQLWFGQFIHGVLEEAYRGYSADRQKPPPWPKVQITQITDRICKRLKAQGLLARSNALEELGVLRAERAVNLLGPHLLPLISRVEVRLSGARPIDRSRMPRGWHKYRNLDRYELVGVIKWSHMLNLEQVLQSTLWFLRCVEQSAIFLPNSRSSSTTKACDGRRQLVNMVDSTWQRTNGNCRTTQI